MYEILMKYFNKQPRLGTLDTVDKNGKVNINSQSTVVSCPLLTDVGIK